MTNKIILPPTNGSQPVVKKWLYKHMYMYKLMYEN